jgi:hypothetical protein
MFQCISPILESMLAVNCRVRRRSSIINLGPSDIVLAILKPALSRRPEIFNLPLAVF